MAKDLVVIPGARILASEVERAEKALAALKKDPHAPRTLEVKIHLHVYNEYPKHVVVGIDGEDVTKVVNSKAEEDALLAEVAKEAAEKEKAEAVAPVAS